jgi:uncharacterized protein
VSAEAAYAWHARAGAIERLTAPWEGVDVIEPGTGLSEGSRTVLRIHRGPFRVRWVTRHKEVVRGRQFVDEQVEGPFPRWLHLHKFEPAGPDSCTLTDRIEYTAPLGAGGARVGLWLVERRIERSLSYRHELLRADLEAHSRFAGRGPLRLVVSGARGTVGSSLLPFLLTGGHSVRRMTRRESLPADVSWSYEQGRIDAVKLDGLDGMVHLAGENVGARWNRGRKRRIWESRAIGTRFLCETLARLRKPPAVLVTASAVGIYGDRGDEVLTETSPLPGRNSDFLAEVAREWEAATEPARAAGIRVVNLRFGIILTPAGGALAKLLIPFRLGLGGPVGSGRQWMSWIGIDDVVGVIHHVLMSEDLSGPVNATAPHPRTNQEFTAALGRTLDRPAKVPLPAAAVRLALGEMGEVTLLSGARVQPARLLETGYAFRHPQLPGALKFLLGTTGE